MTGQKVNLLDRLLDLHGYGLTDTARCELRREAAGEIRTLRNVVGSMRDNIMVLHDRIQQLERLNRIRVHQDNERPR